MFIIIYISEEIGREKDRIIVYPDPRFLAQKTVKTEKDGII